MIPDKPLLQLERVGVGYRTRSGLGRAVRSVSLTMQASESWAVVGESGSGKSTLALALMGLLRKQDVEVTGSALFEREDLLSIPESRLRELRGSRIGMIFQDPMTCLTPHLRIGTQVAEPLVRHAGLSWREALAEAHELLAAMGIEDAAARARQFPHEFSGGMRQRAMIAAAMSCQPDLLIADEPTTALDVTVQKQILDLLRVERQRRNLSLLLITHDLGVVSELCDHVAVMYAGQFVEIGTTADLFANPRHPYTQALLRAVPSTKKPRAGRMFSLPGQPPAPIARFAGCAFAPRCPNCKRDCLDHTPELRTSHGTTFACHYNIRAPRFHSDNDHSEALPKRPAALHCANLTVSYASQGGLLRRPRHTVLRDLSLTIGEGEIVGLVGESGCGKTTLLRTILGLLKPETGSIQFDGADAHAQHDLFRNVQLVFQDPYASLNPRRQIGWTIAEPMRNFLGVKRTELEARVHNLMLEVGLEPAWSVRYPHEFSGGQRQRIGIARALACGPRILLCDEPVSALDVSIQAQILNLLSDLREKRNVAILFVSHDLAVVRQMADRVAVMQNGRVIECRPANDLYRAPEQAYTRTLLAAAPEIPAPAAELSC